jgi:hypothetical protein
MKLRIFKSGVETCILKCFSKQKEISHTIYLISKLVKPQILKNQKTIIF